MIKNQAKALRKEGKTYKEIAEIIKEAVDYKTPTKNESKSVDTINKKLKKSGDNKSDTKFGLTVLCWMDLEI